MGRSYSALTAPGPTGTRLKHAKGCFGCRCKPAAGRLARAMMGTQKRVQKGDHDGVQNCKKSNTNFNMTTESL